MPDVLSLGVLSFILSYETLDTLNQHFMNHPEFQNAFILTFLFYEPITPGMQVRIQRL